MKRCVPLEAEAEAVCEANSKPPLIFELPPAQGRMVLEKAQDSPVYKYPAKVSRVSVNTGRWGTIPVYLVDSGNTPALLYKTVTMPILGVIVPPIYKVLSFSSLRWSLRTGLSGYPGYSPNR